MMRKIWSVVSRDNSYKQVVDSYLIRLKYCVKNKPRIKGIESESKDTALDKEETNELIE